MARNKRVWFLIARKDLEGVTAVDVLDMLRYDGAKVEQSPRLLGIYVLSSEGRVTPGRWGSFGIPVLAVFPNEAEPEVWHKIDDLLNQTPVSVLRRAAIMGHDPVTV